MKGSGIPKSATDFHPWLQIEVDVRSTMWYNLISHDPKESWLLEKEEDDHDGIQAMDPYPDEPKDPIQLSKPCHYR